MELPLELQRWRLRATTAVAAAPYAASAALSIATFATGFSLGSTSSAAQLAELETKHGASAEQQTTQLKSLQELLQATAAQLEDAEVSASLAAGRELERQLDASFSRDPHALADELEDAREQLAGQLRALASWKARALRAEEGRAAAEEEANAAAPPPPPGSVSSTGQLAASEAAELMLRVEELAEQAEDLTEERDGALRALASWKRRATDAEEALEAAERAAAKAAELRPAAKPPSPVPMNPYNTSPERPPLVTPETVSPWEIPRQAAAPDAAPVDVWDAVEEIAPASPTKPLNPFEDMGLHMAADMDGDADEDGIDFDVAAKEKLRRSLSGIAEGDEGEEDEDEEEEELSPSARRQSFIKDARGTHKGASPVIASPAIARQLAGLASPHSARSSPSVNVAAASPGRHETVELANGSSVTLERSAFELCADDHRSGITVRRALAPREACTEAELATLCGVLSACYGAEWRESGDIVPVLGLTWLSGDRPAAPHKAVARRRFLSAPKRDEIDSPVLVHSAFAEGDV